MQRITLLIIAIFILHPVFIDYVHSNLMDISLLSSGYDIGDYLTNHQHSSAPLIVTAIPYCTENEEIQFLPTISSDYSAFTDTLTNHLGNTNDLNGRFSVRPITAFGIKQTDHILPISNHFGGQFIDHIGNANAVPIRKLFYDQKHTRQLSNR